MEILTILIPVSLLLGGIGLASFFWALRKGLPAAITSGRLASSVSTLRAFNCALISGCNRL